MASRIRLSPLVVSLGAAVIMALLLSGSVGAWEGTSASQPQKSSASPQQAVLGSAGESVTLEQPPLCRYGVSAWGRRNSVGCQRGAPAGRWILGLTHRCQVLWPNSPR